jgi:hypothetical protein
MMYCFGLAPPSTPDTPEWLLTVTVILTSIACIAGPLFGFILDRRYTGPYTLRTASSKQKWQWAAMITLWPSLLVPFIGLVAPILSPHPDQWPAFPLICSGVWLVAFPAGTLYKRLNIELTLRGYHKTNELIKSGALRHGPLSLLTGWNKWLLGTELKRFYEEGYPENDDIETQEEALPVAGMTKVIRTSEDISLERGRAWTKAARGKLTATSDNLLFVAAPRSARLYGPESGLPTFEDFSIPISNIKHAVLIQTRQDSPGPLVLKIATADGYWYQFGLNYDPAWETSLPFPVTKQFSKMKWSRYSILVRVWRGLCLLVVLCVIILVVYLVLR